MTSQSQIKTQFRRLNMALTLPDNILAFWTPDRADPDTRRVWLTDKYVMLQAPEDLQPLFAELILAGPTPETHAYVEILKSKAQPANTRMDGSPMFPFRPSPEAPNTDALFTLYVDPYVADPASYTDLAPTGERWQYKPHDVPELELTRLSAAPDSDPTTWPLIKTDYAVLFPEDHYQIYRAPKPHPDSKRSLADQPVVVEERTTGDVVGLIQTHSYVDTVQL